MTDRHALAFRGEADRGFEWLDKAVAYHDGGLAEIVGSPPFANLRQDSRWLPFLRKLGKAPDQVPNSFASPLHVGDDTPLDPMTNPL